MIRVRRAIVSAAIVVLAAVGSLQAESVAELRVATFECDVTPPIGHWLYAYPIKTVEHPLLAKGVVLEQNGARYVLCAIDWCVLSGGAHTLLREKMAEGAGTDPANATIQCVHVHTGPILDTGAKRLLGEVENPPKYYDPAFLEQVGADLADAVRSAVARLGPCDRIGVSQGKIERVASNRRIMVDGKIRWRGSSRGRNQELADLPEGNVDPFLKTITFARGEKPMVRLHYYATHPQSFYRDGRTSYDFPGMAREKLEVEEGVFQIYFTGCGGDVAAGKYNDGTREARQGLYERLLAGMRASVAATEYRPVGPIVWRTVDLVLPPKNVPGYSPEAFRKDLLDPKKSASRRIWCARRMAFYEREEPIAISSLQIGDVFVVHLPGEPMLEFQLFAQEARPDAFVAVAGYGDGSPSYICTDRAFEEGAYEPGASAVGPGSEGILKASIRELLGLREDAPRSQSSRDSWDEIAPFFSPPTDWEDKFGEYRSPLQFADGSMADSADDWAKRRAEILEQWHDLLGHWPPLITEPKVEIIESKRRENFTQVKIRFKWTPQELTTGYLLIPDGDSPRPAVVTVYYEPETAIGLGNPLRDFALQLARRGFVALSLGTTEATAAKTYAIYHPGIDDAKVQPLSMLACAAANAWYVLAARPEVDSERIGIVGHSFGGKWAMFASCLFDKYACAVWSDPGIVFDEARPSVNYWEPWYLGYHPRPWRKRAVISEENPARGLYPRLVSEGRDLHELHALMAPRPFLVSGGSEDQPRRWAALNHSIAVNRLLGHSDRVGMTNRPEHSPNEESNALIYAFFEHFLGPL